MEQPGTKKKANSSEKQSKSKSNLSFASEDQVTKQRGFEQTNKVADSAKGIRRQNKLLQRIKETKVIEGESYSLTLDFGSFFIRKKMHICLYQKDSES